MKYVFYFFKNRFRMVSLTCLCVMFVTTAQELEEHSLTDVNRKSERYKTLEVRAHTGGHLYTGTALTSELESGYGAFEVRLGWQGKGQDHWSAQFGYPSYGIGFYSGFIGNPKVFGNPNALFGFVNFPVSRASRRNIFAIEPSLGLTYNLEPFDAATNPLNDAIGARMAVYFHVNFGFAYKWTSDMDITYGIDFTHFSNGRSFTPNYGLNMLGLNLGLRYHYLTPRNKKNINEPPQISSRYQRMPRIPIAPVDKKGEVLLYTAASSVQTDADAGTNIRYLALSGALDYRYQFNITHAASAGVDYFFDGSLAERFPDDEGKRHLVGLHAGYGFSFYKFTTLLHPGVYITDSRDKTPYYLRVALRYRILSRLGLQVGLKTDGFVADWVEFGLAFKIL